MMSQNRQDTKDRLRGELDYEVNRRAEREIQSVTHKLNTLDDKMGDVAELLRRHIDVAYPAFDGGVDLIAYRGHNFEKALPIQVKARSATCYDFEKRWFDVRRIVLVQVWYVTTQPEFYIFRNVADVESALGSRHILTASWAARGAYNVTNPSAEQIERMQPHRNKWRRIVDALAD